MNVNIQGFGPAYLVEFFKVGQVTWFCTKLGQLTWICKIVDQLTWAVQYAQGQITWYLEFVGQVTWICKTVDQVTWETKREDQVTSTTILLPFHQWMCLLLATRLLFLGVPY